MGRPYMMSHGDILWIGRMRVPMGAVADICDANRTDRGLTHMLGVNVAMGSSDRQRAGGLPCVPRLSPTLWN